MSLILARFVSGIETFKDGRNARLVIDVDTHFTFSHKQEGNLFILSVKEKEKKGTWLFS